MNVHTTRWEVAADRHFPGDWRVEGFSGEDCFVTIFSGPLAERRARHYYGVVTGQ